MKHLITRTCGMNVSILDHSGTHEVNIDHQYGGPSDLREIGDFLHNAARELDAFRTAEDLKAKEAAKFQTHEITPGFQYMFGNDLRTVLYHDDRVLAVGTNYLINMSADSREDFAQRLNDMSMAKKIKK